MCVDPIHPALMGGGMASFAYQHVRNRYERSRSEYSHSVQVRANRARKPSQPGGFAYFLLLVPPQRGDGSKVRGQEIICENNYRE
jgi:hypothetical protein